MVRSLLNHLVKRSVLKNLLEEAEVARQNHVARALIVSVGLVYCRHGRRLLLGAAVLNRSSGVS